MQMSNWVLHYIRNGIIIANEEVAYYDACLTQSNKQTTGSAVTQW